MKCTIILLLAACLQVSANGHAQTISVKLRDIPFEKALKEISQKSGYGLFYLQEQIKEAKPVTISKENTDVRDVLNELFKEQPLKYEITNKTIVVSPKEAKKGVKEIKEGMSAEEVAPLPTIDVSGRVTDEEGNPLVGASITINGKKKGTVTDDEGVFILKELVESDVITISYTGFKNKSFKVGNITSIIVKLEPDASPLNEIQVIAYGTQTKRYSLGNITTVKAEEIERQPVQNPILALQGRVPGLEITQTTGMAGGRVRIRIQGQNTIADSRSEPLIIIDGVPYPATLPNSAGTSESPISGGDNTQGGSPLNFINPLDIESIEVLKDADATAIYGSRGANGVILITTKKGKPGKNKVSLRLQQGWGKVTRKANMMNARQYLDMRYEAIRNDGLDITSALNNDLRLWDTTRNTNWQKELIGQTAQYTTLNTTLSGGTNQVQYLVGATYNKVTDVLPGDFDSKTGTLHFNIGSSSINQRFRMELSGSYSYNQNELPGVDLTQQALFLPPIAPALYDSAGFLNWAPNLAGTSTWDNPLKDIFSRTFRHSSKTFVNNMQLSYTVLPSLIAKASLGYNNMASQTFTYVGMEYRRPEDRPNSQRIAYKSESTLNTWIVEPQLTYQVGIGKAKLDLLAGSTIQGTQNAALGVNGTGFSSDLLINSMGAATAVTSTSTGLAYKYNALFGRANLNFDGKYLFSINARRDGSSRFGDANKFHNFASAGVGWIFTEEKFLNSLLPFLSFGKIKVSYGSTGGDILEDYSYLSLYSTTPAAIAYQGVAGLGPVRLPNPHLQWQEVKKLSIGIDLGIWSDRVLLNATFNRNECSNQLQSFQLPAITGFNSITKNFPALVRNTSLEFSLNTTNVKVKDFTWTSSANLTIPHNKLVDFPGIENTSYANGNSGVIIGQPLGVINVYKYMGVDPLTGVHMVADQHGNPTSSPSSNTDKTKLLSTLSRYYGGVQNSIQYKGLQISFLFQFNRQLGQRIGFFYGSSSPPGRFVSLGNQPVSVFGRWQKPGDIAEIGRFTTVNTGNAGPRALESDAGYSFDASYIRLKNLSIAWHLPEEWVRKAWIQQATINLQAQNILTISRFSGLDPETKGLSLPPLEMWTLGLRLDF